MTDPLRGMFHHIDLMVTDVVASKRIYGPMLEYMGYRPSHEGPQGCAWELTNNGRGASLMLRPCEPAQATYAHQRYAPGLHHLAWRAASREDVDTLYRLLVDHGATILDAPAHYPQYSDDYYAVFLEDPDGIKLEFAHTPGWI